ncbi:phosphatidylethanolamine-binding protein [Linnemannia elongata]|nr:phosphatidylethanolamine-binding protein [Linnemannia elongata]
MPLITSEQATEAALKQEGIIPDVLDSFHPKTILMVSYGSNNEVALGNTLSVEDTQQAPQVSFQAESPSDQYTLIMTDPDAPSRKDPKMREYRHWVVANISGTSDFQPANVAQGSVVTSYMGPAPPAGSGPHRYIFLLYKQTPSTNVSALTTPLGSHRQGFKAKHFSSQAHLELVGANYFFAENP